MPLMAVGTTTLNIVFQRAIPRASDASRKSPGTRRTISSVERVMDRQHEDRERYGAEDAGALFSRGDDEDRVTQDTDYYGRRSPS